MYLLADDTACCIALRSNGVGCKFEEDRNMPCSLPGNGGLLTAIAMMAGGFVGPDGAARAVGFPPAWGARAEGFRPFP